MPRPGKDLIYKRRRRGASTQKDQEEHQDKGVRKEENTNDKVREAGEDKEKEKVPDAEAKGSGDEPDGDGIAESSGAGDPSQGESVMKPNGNGDGDAGKVDDGESPPKADEGSVCIDEKEGTKEVDEPMEEGEQGGEAKPREDVDDKPATTTDTSLAVAQERRSDEAPKTNTPNKEGLDATQKRWSSPPQQ